MPLPTVLMTDVIRSAHQGDSHGGAYLIDLESDSVEQVLDWRDINIDWEGRGTGRGLRGIAFWNDEIIIAASERVLVFNKGFELVRHYENQYLSHCHETFLEGDSLFLTSTMFDSILELDLSRSEFVSGLWMQPRKVQQRTPQGPRVGLTMNPRTFDPNAEGGPTRADAFHINSVWRLDGRSLFSGVRLPGLFAAERESVTRYAAAPTWTHNCRPHGELVLYNATEEDSILLAERDGAVVERFGVPTYDKSALEKSDLPQDFARQGFGRGLCTTRDGLIVGGSSPATVTVYQQGAGLVKSVNVSMDVRKAPHGLEVWPF